MVNNQVRSPYYNERHLRIGSSTLLLKRAMSKYWATKENIWLDIAKNAAAQLGTPNGTK